MKRRTSAVLLTIGSLAACISTAQLRQYPERDNDSWMITLTYDDGSLFDRLQFNFYYIGDEDCHGVATNARVEVCFNGSVGRQAVSGSNHVYGIIDGWFTNDFRSSGTLQGYRDESKMTGVWGIGGRQGTFTGTKILVSATSTQESRLVSSRLWTNAAPSSSSSATNAPPGK